jgi:hypothetical protein
MYTALLIQLKIPHHSTSNQKDFFSAAPETPSTTPTQPPTQPYYPPSTSLQPIRPNPPLEPTLIEPVTPIQPQATLQPQPKTPFQKLIEKITKPTSGTKSTPNNTSTNPPVTIDCSTSQDININLNLSCHQNHRTYTTNILTVENTESYSCNFTIKVDSSSGPPVSNNFSTGDADFILAFTTVDPSSLTTLPEPKTINNWTEWEQSPIQFEIINGSFQTSSDTETYTIPGNSTRALSLVSDCGSNIIQNENIIIKLNSSFSE